VPAQPVENGPERHLVRRNRRGIGDGQTLPQREALPRERLRGQVVAPRVLDVAQVVAERGERILIRQWLTLEQRERELVVGAPLRLSPHCFTGQTQLVQLGECP
jgi:hypothetical protein